MRNVIASIFACFISTFAIAQEWPRERTIEITVPSAAGSAPDANMRAYTEKLSQALGQSIIISNRAGASGAIGASAAARAAPNGYNFVMLSPGHLIVNKYTIKNLSYDPDSDFKPVALLNVAPYFLLSNKDLPFDSLDGLTKYANSNKGKLFIAYESATARALTAHLINSLGVEITSVPYVNPSQLMQDLLTGNVQLTIQGSALGLAFVNDKRVTALAVTGAKRFTATPDVPTIAETNSAFGSFDAWLMLLAPAGTPDVVIKRLSAELGKIAAMPETQQVFNNLGLAPAEDYSPEYAAAFIRRESAQFAKMAKQSNLKPE